jgi:hypothetical protein
MKTNIRVNNTSISFEKMLGPEFSNRRTISPVVK